MEKLKITEILRDNPDFELLLKCWEDEPVLQIAIKKLVAKFPQCGIAYLDGMLVNWNE